MMTKAKQGIELIPVPLASTLRCNILEVRRSLGVMAGVRGAVWQEMRDEWSSLVKQYRALYGLPVAIEGGLKAKARPAWWHWTEEDAPA